MGTQEVITAVRGAAAQIIRDAEDNLTFGDLCRVANALGFRPSDLVDEATATKAP